MAWGRNKSRQVRRQTSLESQISYTINAPAALISSTLARFLSMKWPTSYAAWFFFTYVFYFVLVAALWYVVSLEASGTEGSSLTRLVVRKAYRKFADALLVALGLLLVFMGVLNLGFIHEALRTEMASSIGFLLWGLLITSFYGRDLYAFAGGSRGACDSRV
jgi:hypothetical protein